MPGNAVEVEGKGNRVAGRDYIELKLLPESTTKELLVSAQRKRLNALVAEIALECETAGPTLWRDVVHAQLGVESINGITRDQYQAALDALDMYRSNHRDQAVRRELVDKIKRLARRKNITFELGRYSLREFGEQHLESLPRAELLRALAFTDDYEVPVKAPTVAPVTTMPLRQLVTSHPLQASVLLVMGFVVGKIF